jgi:hypothetical protein
MIQVLSLGLSLVYSIKRLTGHAKLTSIAGLQAKTII